MSTYILLLLLLMNTSSSRSDEADCPVISNCQCIVPRALRCSGAFTNFYQETMKALAHLPDGAVELLEVHFENSSVIGPLTLDEDHLDLPRLMFSSANGLRTIDERSFGGLEDYLQHLSFAENKLAEVPSAALRGLVNLRTLDLRRNAISRLRAPDFKGLTNLTHLDLSDNLLTDLPDGIFRGLYNLHELIVRNNSLTKKSLTVFAEAQNLREIDLSSNRLDCNVDEELMPNLPNLEILKMQNNNLKSVRSGSLAGCPQLQTLNLSHNSVEVLEDGAFLLLSDLQILDLSHNEIVSVSRLSMRGLTNLRVLRLTANHLRAISVDLVTHIRGVQELWVDSNDIARVEQGVPKLISKDLRSLRLADNPFECDCSIREFAKWLRNSSSDPSEVASAVCATPVDLVGATLATTGLDEFTCSLDQEEEEWGAEVKRLNQVLPTVPGLPASTGSIRLHQYTYDPESGVVLTWDIAPGPSFTCDAIFIYETQQSGTGHELLLDSNPVRCSRQYAEENADSEEQWRRVTLTVPGSLDLRDRGLYRYCLVLTRSLEGASDDVDFALGCSDLIQLYKNGEQLRSPDAAIKFLSSAVSRGGELRLHVSVRTSVADKCALGVAVLAQGSVIARRDAPCNVLVRLQGFLEGPYTVCVALAGHTVPGPHARCASVIRNTQTHKFPNSRAGTLIILGVLGCLLILIIGTITAFVVIKLMKRHRQPYHAYYVKLHSNTTSL